MALSLAPLYDLADEMFRFAPWAWMRETQLIGIRHPETGELAYVSVMGDSGGRWAVALYLGTEAIERFNLIQEGAGGSVNLAKADIAALRLESRQLQASWTARADLLPSELGEIKALGRTYPGEHWPCFRTFHAGWAPRPIDTEEEAVWLRIALEQVLAVGKVLEENCFGDYRPTVEGLERLTRERGADGAWRTVWTPDPHSVHRLARPEPGKARLAQVAALPAGKLQVECLFQILATPVGKRGQGQGQAQLFPYLTLSLEAASGAILGSDLLTVETQTHGELIASVPDAFLGHWLKLKGRPASISVASASSQAILEKTAAALGIRLERKARIPALEEAFAGVMGKLRGGGN